MDIVHPILALPSHELRAATSASHGGARSTGGGCCMTAEERDAQGMVTDE